MRECRDNPVSVQQKGLSLNGLTGGLWKWKGTALPCAPNTVPNGLEDGCNGTGAAEICCPNSPVVCAGAGGGASCIMSDMSMASRVASYSTGSLGALTGRNGFVVEKFRLNPVNDICGMEYPSWGIAGGTTVALVSWMSISSESSRKCVERQVLSCVAMGLFSGS